MFFLGNCTYLGKILVGQLVPLFGATKQHASKNREIGGALALGGCRFMMQYNNQTIVGVCGFYDDIAEARPGWSILGGTMALFWPLNE